MQGSQTHTGQDGHENGFTLVEIMVAAVVLLVGVLGTLSMLDQAVGRTSANSNRVGATNLARELVESARGVDYNALTTTALPSTLQAQGLGAGSPWKIQRRGVDFTVQASACTYDAPTDQLASPVPDNVCTPQPSAPSGDQNGDDFRRVTFTLSWIERGAPRSLTQTALIVNPTGGLGPRITAIDPTQQRLGPFHTTAALTVTTTSARTVRWNVNDGQTQGVATGPSGSPQRWGISWNLGLSGAGDEVLDGPYQIVIQAFDDRNIAGEAKLATVVLNRRITYPPPSLAGGHDTRVGDWVDLTWGLNRERDVIGYRVYWAGADQQPLTADDVLVCPAAGGMLSTTTTSCTDSSPASSGSTRYVIRAVDRDEDGATREGDGRQLVIAAPGPRPARPAGPLEASVVDGSLQLSWAAPASGSPSFYRIYRDGTGLDDRLDRTSGAETSWRAGPGDPQGHQYWITTVDANFNESDPVGPVTYAP